MAQNINFFNQDISYTLREKNKLREWIKSVIKNEKKKVGEISFIFSSDEYLLSINKTYLKHNFFTDVISFDYSEGKEISGDIFISIERVKDNSKKYHKTFQNELRRVIIHGVLHLTGYKDKTESEIKNMREKEDLYLIKYSKI